MRWDAMQCNAMAHTLQCVSHDAICVCVVTVYKDKAVPHNKCMVYPWLVDMHMHVTSHEHMAWMDVLT